MHVICNKQLLVEAVSNVSRAVSSRNTLAALEGILLKTAAGTISLTGYDLELAITKSKPTSGNRERLFCPQNCF